MVEKNDRNLKGLGPVLAKMRLEKGFTQIQVAEHLNITATAITMIETGRRMPSLDNILYKMSNLYETPLSEIFKKVEEVE